MIAIIDYEAGNLTSVERAVASLGVPCRITRDPGEAAAADRLIFPGVGAAGATMANLARFGMDRVLREAHAAHKPVLGICVGCQVIFEHSEEDGGTPCLGLLPGKVVRFDPALADEDGRRIKIPHMGYNGVTFRKPHPLFQGLPPEAEFYFVHSFHPVPSDPAVTIGLTRYGREFASAVGRGSLVAVQFHLEKSGRPGLQVLRNFTQWDGKEAADAV